MKRGASGSSRSTAFHSWRSISSVFGGKSSKETLSAPWASGPEKGMRSMRSTRVTTRGISASLADERRAGLLLLAAPRGPDHNGERIARQLGRALRLEAGGAAPLPHLGVAEAEPAMGVLGAQVFELVGREIDDDEQPARPQHAADLGDRRGGIVGEMQHLVDGRGVEGGGRPGELVHVALPDHAVAHARLLEIGARHRQHLAREIDADGALDARRHQLEDAAGAGADIDEVADALLRQEVEQRALDL